MQRPPRNNVLRYGTAALGVALATAARLALDPILGDLFPFATLFFAVLVVAGYAGRRPRPAGDRARGLGLGTVPVPASGQLLRPGAENQAGVVLYVTIGLGIALLGGALRDARRRAEAVADEAVRQREELRITLSSIGDAVIVTDTEGRVTSLNPVAEALTAGPRPRRPGSRSLRSSASSTRRPAGRSRTPPSGRWRKGSWSGWPTTPS